MTQSSMDDLCERTCPRCGGEMFAEHDDRYCLVCIHEGRV
jgi:ribosomal protein S27AE